MTDAIHADAGIVSFALDAKLAEGGVKNMKNARCISVCQEGVTVLQDGKEIFLEGDTVILAVGMRPRMDVFESLLSSAPIVEPIGDCVTPATVQNATRTAFGVANNL